MLLEAVNNWQCRKKNELAEAKQQISDFSIPLHLSTTKHVHLNWRKLQRPWYKFLVF
jgi:hypothetical protein